MSDFDEAAEAQKYADLRAELGMEEPAQVAEEHTIAQPQHQDRYEPQEHHQQQGIPHVYEDPLGHFHTRASQVETHLQQRALIDAVQSDEKAAEAEVADYWDACAHLEQARIRELERQIPDGAQGDLYAHRHGLRNAAEARAAHLNMERQQVVVWAMQNGISPAQAYYHLAQQKGYRPTSVPRSLVQQVRQAKSDDDYDKAWAKFAKASRAADENHRFRR